MILQSVLPVLFCNKFCLIFTANICVYFSIYFMHVVCANIFGAIVLKPRFKIDAVIMIICSIVIIINSVLKVLSNGAGGGPKLVSIDPF